jgi:pimeloyl-ACP methyl ester carboxylesterase
MRRTVPLLLLALLLTAAPAAAKVRTGPAGTAFYTPPSPLPGKKHGDLIWARKVTGADALKSASSNRLVLYRSSGVGKTVAVSGTVAVPKGKAPKGGWPVITWGHGTTGMGDQCAPSRDATKQIGYAQPLFNTWLKDGYAVVITDYEGLGTPGVHPFLNGDSEGYGVLDIVRAARQLDPSLGKRVVIAGHSQGGQAALFAASLAKRWTPELTLRGTVAFAPVSHLSEQVPLARALKDPSPLTAFAVMIARGIDLADPSLHVASLLSDKAAPLYPSVDTSCLDDLRKPESFGNIAPAEIFRDDADLNPAAKALDREDDAENLTIKTPVRIEQGSADQTVLPIFTDQLASALQKKGTKVGYKKYDGVTHGGAVTEKAPSADATAYIKALLK